MERPWITALPGIRVIRLISDGVESWIECNICSTPMVICPSKATASSLVRPIATILLLLLLRRSLIVLMLLSLLKWWQSLLQGSLDLPRVMCMWHVVPCLQVSLCSLHCLRVRPLLRSFHRVLWTSPCSSLDLVLALLLLSNSFESLRTWPTCHWLLLSNFWGFCGMLERWNLFVFNWLSVCCLSVRIETSVIWKWPCSLYHIRLLLRIGGCLGHSLWSNWPIWDSLHVALRIHIHSEMVFYLTCEIIVIDRFIALTLTMIRHRNPQPLYVWMAPLVFLIRRCFHIWWSCCLFNRLSSL